MVKGAMARESLGPDYALRLGVVGGGCSGFSYAMSFDNQPKPDDAVVEAGGIKVLIDAASIEYLAGTTLDYVSGLHGSAFSREPESAAHLRLRIVVLGLIPASGGAGLPARRLRPRRHAGRRRTTWPTPST